MEVFKWRKSVDELPPMGMFGYSSEVIGLTSDRTRAIYLYSYKNDRWESRDTNKPPILWHYLPSRPTSLEIQNEFNIKEPELQALELSMGI